MLKIIAETEHQNHSKNDHVLDALSLQRNGFFVLHERTAQLKNNVDFGFICGFNIAILSALFATLFSRLLGRWRGAVAAQACIAVYTLLVGGEPPVVRAALMGGLALLAVQLGHRMKKFRRC
jgi:hypothetical protein